MVCFGSAISIRCTIMAAGLGLLRDRGKKGENQIVMPKHQEPIHPEWLSTTLTRFYYWLQVGYKIRIEPNGFYFGERKETKQ